MAVDHMLRLRVRMQAGSYRREADMAFPEHSTLVECLSELLSLCDAPMPTRPWQARSSIGREIDATAPLSRTGLRDGDTLLLIPRQETPPPVVRDATEALVEAASACRSVTPDRLVHVYATTGLIACAALLSHWLPLWASFLPPLAAAFLLTLWVRPMPGVIACGIACAGAAGFLWVYHSAPQGWIPYAALSGLLSVGMALVLFALSARTLPPRAVCSTATACLLGISAPILWWLTHQLPGVAAGIILLSFLILFLAPRLATTLAGLSPPRIPSAGQDLRLADAHPAHAERRARRAQLLYEGFHLGIAAALCPALLCLGLVSASSTGSTVPTGSALSTVLVLGVSLVSGIHALRHPHPYAVWSQVCASLSGMLAAIIMAHTHIASEALGFLLVAGCLSAPWWLTIVPPPEPTQIVWWERLESLAVAAIFPLCLHHMGFFALIRGLG
ncbi:type VII secretion integral membrane protein EccD [Corynebacterium mastitidis]|uniref:Type VII secretion integral membrane protein EccD n=1 Tax=Corynebacterium mastitidis TaxID=161890 RepID=A0ABU8NX13_9CORY